MAECIRRAWLTLGALTMPLEDEDAGYYCTQLDLGYPAVREVVTNRPDQDGVDDRTAYFGSRVVSANITAQSPAAVSVDAIAASFAPFMVPSVRPVLHYVLERPGAAERTLTVRAANYTWPISGGTKREIQLQWVAADAIASAAAVRTATAWAGSDVKGGRVYNLTFNRTYGAEGGSFPTTATLRTDGDVPAWPLLRVYGPITLPFLAFGPAGQIKFLAPFAIDAGHFVEISTADRTVFLDGDLAQPAFASLDWRQTKWPSIAPGPGIPMSISGTSTTHVTQVQATWQDRYLV